MKTNPPIGASAAFLKLTIFGFGIAISLAPVAVWIYWRRKNYWNEKMVL